MQDTQALLPVKASGMGAEIKEIFDHIGFNTAKFRFCLFVSFCLNAKNKVFLFDNPIVPLCCLFL